MNLKLEYNKLKEGFIVNIKERLSTILTDTNQSIYPTYDHYITRITNDGVDEENYPVSDTLLSIDYSGNVNVLTSNLDRTTFQLNDLNLTQLYELSNLLDSNYYTIEQ